MLFIWTHLFPFGISLLLLDPLAMPAICSFLCGDRMAPSILLSHSIGASLLPVALAVPVLQTWAEAMADSTSGTTSVWLPNLCNTVIQLLSLTCKMWGFKRVWLLEGVVGLTFFGRSNKEANTLFSSRYFWALSLTCILSITVRSWTKRCTLQRWLK